MSLEPLYGLVADIALIVGGQERHLAEMRVFQRVEEVAQVDEEKGHGWGDA